MAFHIIGNGLFRFRDYLTYQKCVTYGNLIYRIQEILGLDIESNLIRPIVYKISDVCAFAP